MMICTLQILYRRSCPWYTGSVSVFILERRVKKNSRQLSKLWLKEMVSRCRRMNFCLKRISGSCLMEDLTGRTAQQFIDHLLGIQEE